MGWKNLPYWLRGGIIAIIIFIILVVITSISDRQGTSHPGALIIPLLPGLALTNHTLYRSDLLINGFISLIIYFIIGALIGFIIGKIKNK